MNICGKSDGLIVPEKLPNKDKESAEGVEERSPAKRKTFRQTRFWTQGQEDLQHATERIRQAGCAKGA
jgi:hypothetical protein